MYLHLQMTGLALSEQLSFSVAESAEACNLMTNPL